MIKKLEKGFGIFMVFILFLGLAVTTTNHVAKASSTQTKYVTADILNVRSGPGTNYRIITTVKHNQAVQVYQTSGSWSKVNINNKTTGWVSNTYLTIQKPSASINLANTLKTVGKNRQLILVTSNGYSSNQATIRTFEKNPLGKWTPILTTTGYIGKYGFTNNMSEGALKSPVGKYTIGIAFGQKGNPGTKLSFRQITSDDVWVDDPKSSLYNTWQSKSKTKGKWNSAESMTNKLYVYGFVINYNTQRIPYKGSAIFFHVGTSYTAGCTATSEKNVVSILKWLNPAKNPVIIQTPLQNLSKY